MLRALPMAPDQSAWEFWWEWNRDDLLAAPNAVRDGSNLHEDFGGQTDNDNRRRSARAIRPTSAEIANEVVPTLLRTLQAAQWRPEEGDLVRACLVALARIDAVPDDLSLLPVFAEHLRSDDVLVRATAALAFGIAAIPGDEARDLLIDLALDTPNGQAACGRPVDERTRTFALYGLGLVAGRSQELATKRLVFAALRTLLESDPLPPPDLQVAALQACGQLAIPTGTSDGEALLTECLTLLHHEFTEPRSIRATSWQAHVPTAVARLLDGAHPRAAGWKQRFADELADFDVADRRRDRITESCALALGGMCRSRDDTHDPAHPDHGYGALLQRVAVEHTNPQTRFFALLSLSRLGGVNHQQAILRVLDQGTNPETPWAALALGLSLRDEVRADDRTTEPIDDVRRRLQEELRRARDPSLVGALGIALGLSHTYESADTMLSLLRKSVAKEEMTGHLAIGLAQMDDGPTRTMLGPLLAETHRRQTLSMLGALALGQGGDQDAAALLTRLLRDSDGRCFRQQAAFASAIGRIGDVRSIHPLRMLLRDETRSVAVRAAAAAALGMLADDDAMPWNPRYAAGTNYRVAPPTLHDGTNGIVDLL
jgi:HEAT repeat protein